MDVHPYGRETSLFTLGAPYEEAWGRRTKLRELARVGTIFFVITRNLMMETLGKGDKSAIKNK